MTLDYKDWIQSKADELALEEYDRDFYELTDEAQDRIYNRAVELYKDYMADRIDMVYERVKYG